MRDLSSGEKAELRTGPSRWRLVTSARNHTLLRRRGRDVAQAAQARRRGRVRRQGPVTVVRRTATATTAAGCARPRPSPGAPPATPSTSSAWRSTSAASCPREMPPSWSTEAVRAQAIAARTYAAYERAHPRATHFQICDTTSCQVYGGVASEAARRPRRSGRRRARSSSTPPGAGVQPVLVQQRRLDAAGSVPYLAGQADPYDGWRQPEPRLDPLAQRRRDRERPGRRSGSSSSGRRRARRGWRLGRPGSSR